MGNETSDNASSSVLKNAFLAVAVIAALVLAWAYYQEKGRTDIAQTESAALTAMLAEVEDDLAAEKAKPVTFEYARPVAAEEPRLYIQVQAGKNIRFYNRTAGDDLEITYEPGAFPDLEGQPIKVVPTKHGDYTLNPEVPDGHVYVIEVNEPLKHGGSEMIVGSGP